MAIAFGTCSVFFPVRVMQSDIMIYLSNNHRSTTGKTFMDTERVLLQIMIRIAPPYRTFSSWTQLDQCLYLFEEFLGIQQTPG